MTRIGWLAASVVVLASQVCLSQDRPPPAPIPYQLEIKPRVDELWTVRIETFNNKGVTGKLLLSGITMDCELGMLDVKLEKIKTIEFSKPRENRSPFETPHFSATSRGVPREGAVIMTSGEAITGTIYVPSWSIETELGTLTPDASRIKTMTFVSKVHVASQPISRKPGEPAKAS